MHHQRGAGISSGCLLWSLQVQAVLWCCLELFTTTFICMCVFSRDSVRNRLMAAQLESTQFSKRELQPRTPRSVSITSLSISSSFFSEASGMFLFLVISQLSEETGHASHVSYFVSSFFTAAENIQPAVGKRTREPSRCEAAISFVISSSRHTRGARCSIQHYSDDKEPREICEEVVTETTAVLFFTITVR